MERSAFFLINGGPGTGKSVIAVNLMAQLLIEGLDASRFRHFNDIQTYNSKNITKPKNNNIAVFCPYVTKTEAPRSVYKTLLTMHSSNGKKWTKADVEGLFIGAGKFREKPNSPIFAGLIVDEAHRLKDTDRFSNGSCYVENIITSAYTSVVFIDDKQRISTEDFGTVSTIREIAKRNGYEVIEDKLNIQFRCGGCDEYISLIDSVLYSDKVPIGRFFGNYDFKVFDDPEKMHKAIIEKNKLSSHLSSRVSAGYCWNWVSKKDEQLNDIQIKRPNGAMYFRKWNLSKSKKPFAIDEFSEDLIGCIHTTQGLEFEYAGVIIGPDLRLEGIKLITDATKRARTDNSINNRKVAGKAKLDEIIKNTYRVLLTRGQKGTYVYCTDEKLSSYLKTVFNC